MPFFCFIKYKLNSDILFEYLLLNILKNKLLYNNIIKSEYNKYIIDN